MKNMFKALLAISMIVPAMASASMEGDKQKILMILAASAGKSGKSAYKNVIQDCRFDAKEIKDGAEFTITTASGESIVVVMMKQDLERGYDTFLSEDGYGKLSSQALDGKSRYTIGLAIDEQSTDISLLVGVKKEGLFGRLIKDVEYKTKRIECSLPN